MTAPLRPAGATQSQYSIYRKVGYIFSDASVHFLPFVQYGSRSERFYQWDVPVEVLTTGSSATFAAVDLSTGMPPIATPVYLNAIFKPATAENVASLRPTGSSALISACAVTIDGVVAAKNQNFASIKILPQIASSVPKIDYVVSNSSDDLTLSIMGFDFTI
jgi:hypothetical protein